MTDPHVHLRDWNQQDKETIRHGLETVKSAGFDCVFDMPNTNPPVVDRETALKRLELGCSEAERLGMKYHLYLGLTSDEKQIKQMVAIHKELFPAICGLKLFASQSTGNMGITEKSGQNGIYRTLARLNYTGVLAVHCEKEQLFNRTALSHSLVRTPESEVESVRDQIELAENNSFRGLLHIAHISTEKALQLVIQAKQLGQIRISCGATPHHCLFNSSYESTILKMNPPLRPEQDRQAIFNGLINGSIDWVESDHAPHTLEDKQKGASGIPGIEGMLLLIRKLREHSVTQRQLNDLFGNNALKLFGINETTSPVPEIITDSTILRVRNEYPFSAFESLRKSSGKVPFTKN